MFNTNFILPINWFAFDLINFHTFLIFFLIYIACLVFFFLYHLQDYKIQKNFIKIGFLFVDSIKLELIWIIYPIFIILTIAIASFSLLYGLEITNTGETSFVIKILGHQWYWSYEYLLIPNNFLNILMSFNEPLNNIYIEAEDLKFFDSYMIDEKFLISGQYRLVEVDKPLYLAKNILVKFSVSSADVLHSWSLPSIGCKIDACPGRYVTAITSFFKSGFFYGQCSELCGINHSYMPIVLTILQKELYFIFYLNFELYNLYNFMDNDLQDEYNMYTWNYFIQNQKLYPIYL